MVQMRHIALGFFLSPTVYAAGADGESLLRTLAALVLVICVIFLLAKLLKRMQGSAMGTKSKLKVISQLALGPKERVLVIDVNGEQVLIGVTSMQITLLKTLDKPFADTEEIVSFTSLFHKSVKKNDTP